ncbi:uncharacterized protein A4U43_C05F15760 [Asparagus officinalis]|uniref:Rab proteins geranylgeranyltransferase component n=1 Tax=Asparagus officinalis TaxID=4686 RepID=A0A5P1ESI6_ASPOF|nr:uncharacterized protein A4U43_C05F15760 [Asparagus officinalis]
MAATPTVPNAGPTSYDLIIHGTRLLLHHRAAARRLREIRLHLRTNPSTGPLRLLPLHPPFSHKPPASFQNFQSSPSTSPAPGSSTARRHGRRPSDSGAGHQCEFKSVDGSLIIRGALCSSADSRQAIFKDRSLELGEKREMMRFLRLVQGHIGDEEGSRVSEEDLEMPFVEFLKRQRLPPKIRSIILYAIVLAEYDQESGEGCKKLIKTKDGIASIGLYIKSVGRFPNAVGAFIYPMYGHGELPQAFCRCAAVKGALYVLRMPVVEILADEETKEYKGVNLASGQEILSQHLIVEPSSKVPSSVLLPLDHEGSNASNLSEKVARGVCVTSSSLKQDLSNILVIFPPGSLHAGQLTTVRALQLSSNVAVCPQGMYVVHLSTSCDSAMNALFSLPNLDNCEGISRNNEGAEVSKPTLIWSAVYDQEVTQASFGTVCSSPLPDANLDYRDLLESTMELFSHMYPQEEFLPQVPATENDDEDYSGSSEQ